MQRRKEIRVLPDMEVVKEIHWKKHRQEIIDREDRKERIQRIEKAKRLNKTWELSRECRRMLQELNPNWVNLEDKKEVQEEKTRRVMQVEKAREKKRKFKEMELIKTKNKKISEMLINIPKTETKRIKDELREMKANLWRKWRGNGKVMENKEYNERNRSDKEEKQKTEGMVGQEKDDC